LETIARFAITRAAVAGLSSNSTSPTLLPSNISVMNACSDKGVPIIT
jgi:hypothetical protein